MCVYHYEDSKRAQCWIFILLLAAILFSFAVAAPMLILTYPGDECLLFVSVRGEALIYGNPAGCNFIAYGHQILILTAFVVLGLIFCRRKKGILRRKAPKEIGSTRSLRGSQVPTQNGIGLGQSHYHIQSEDTVSQFGVSRFYSTKAIVFAAFAGIFSLITALVILSGYLVTCNELQYETRRGVYKKTTLGSPIKHLNIQCWSLFRDVDFHTRFHFDHYEFSGQWHGQYRGYKHGRVHDFQSSHEHLIDVALALELSLASTWICSALWITVSILMVLLKKRQKYLQKRELAESIEDAAIFASSRQLDPTQNIMMNPIDQMSVTSNQSSVLSQKPSVISATGTSVSTNPMGTHKSPQPVVVQQQMMSQQELLNQQMLQMQQLQLANQQRLHQSQPVLTQQTQQAMTRPVSQQAVSPMTNYQYHAQVQAQQVAQQAQLAQQATQQAAQRAQQAAQQTQQVQQVAQQNGVQYVQLSNGMLMPVVAQQAAQQQTQQSLSPTEPKNVSQVNKHHYSTLQEAKAESKSKSAQKAQLQESQDAGLKCSQI